MRGWTGPESRPWLAWVCTGSRCHTGTEGDLGGFLFKTDALGKSGSLLSSVTPWAPDCVTMRFPGTR